MIKKNGFTLAEILIALAIISAALIPMTIMWTSIQRFALNEGSLAQQARTLGQIVIEDVIDDIVNYAEVKFDSSPILNPTSQ